MRQLNDKHGLAPILTVVLLFAGPAALRAGDQPSEPHGPADLPSLENASLAEPAIDAAATNRAVIMRFIDEYQTGGDEAVLHETVAPRMVNHTMA